MMLTTEEKTNQRAGEETVFVAVDGGDGDPAIVTFRRNAWTKKSKVIA